MEQTWDQEITDQDRESAQECVECAFCRAERDRPHGIPLWFLNTVERLCRYREGYEKVYGRKAHDTMADDDTSAV